MSTTVWKVFPIYIDCRYGLYTWKEIHNSDLTGLLFLLRENNLPRKILNQLIMYGFFSLDEQLFKRLMKSLDSNGIISSITNVWKWGHDTCFASHIYTPRHQRSALFGRFAWVLFVNSIYNTGHSHYVQTVCLRHMSNWSELVGTDWQYVLDMYDTL